MPPRKLTIIYINVLVPPWRPTIIYIYILVPPGRPTIIDGVTDRPANSKIGPYRIGDNVTLTCLVIGTCIMCIALK